MKKIIELSERCPNITIAVRIDDLLEFHRVVIEDTKRKLEQSVLFDRSETYPTPAKVCEMLSVDRSTLWRWKKRGYLIPVEIGGKHRYRMSDINKLLGKEVKL